MRLCMASSEFKPSYQALTAIDGDEHGYNPSSHYLVHCCALSSTFLLDVYIDLTVVHMMCHVFGNQPCQLVCARTYNHVA